jgi:hypothetical protein
MLMLADNGFIDHLDSGTCVHGAAPGSRLPLRKARPAAAPETTDLDLAVPAARGGDVVVALQCMGVSMLTPNAFPVRSAISGERETCS